MNPWIFLTIPAGLFFVSLTIAFVYLLIIEIFFPQATADGKARRIVEEEFFPTSVQAVWKMHDKGIEPDLYIRVPKKKEQSRRTGKKAGHGDE